MIRAALIAAFLISAWPPARAERLWLVVGASDSSPAGIARQAKSLSKHFPDGFVVQMSDCGGSENLFIWVARAAATPEEADTEIWRLHNAGIKDAAVTCGQEVAIDFLLDRVEVFDAAGNKISSIDRCRDPAFYGDRIITCQSESVVEDGRLELTAIRTVLPKK